MGPFRKSEHRGIEEELRENRPELHPERLAAIAGETHDGRRRRAAGRTGLAVALSVTVLAVSASLGGIGYAAAAGKQVLKATKIVDSPASSGASTSKSKPDDDQYKPGKGCGDKNHVHSRENECKKPPK